MAAEPEVIVRQWIRPCMGLPPMLTLHVLNGSAREAETVIHGVEVLGRSHNDPPCALVMPPLPEGFNATSMTLYGSGVKGVRRVQLYADRAAFDAGQRRQAPDSRGRFAWLERER